MTTQLRLKPSTRRSDGTFAVSIEQCHNLIKVECPERTLQDASWADTRSLGSHSWFRNESRCLAQIAPQLLVNARRCLGYPTHTRASGTPSGAWVSQDPFTHSMSFTIRLVPKKVSCGAIESRSRPSLLQRMVPASVSVLEVHYVLASLFSTGYRRPPAIIASFPAPMLRSRF